MTNYKCITKRQVDILYAKCRAGEIYIPDDIIRKMYDVSEVMWDKLDYDERDIACMIENALDFLFDGERRGINGENNIELAQAILNGYKVREVNETFIRPATEDDWFFDIGEPIEEEQFMGWKIC